MEGVAAAIGMWILSSLMGGGVALTIAYLALREKLSRDLATSFATKAENEAVASDINSLGSRVNGLETVAIMARDNSDANEDRLTRLEQSVSSEQNALSRTLTRIDETMREFDERQRLGQREIDRTVALLDALEKRMDRHSNHGRD